ncbi:DNA repair protein [Xanthomonas hortorum]|nr:DNA repair protein [Xanthomonas hortorum]MCE4369713.1 hypothetical protein [Xanthomonas hortorum pv. hederae]PPU86249.1 DNA repair protein [Xanthomonas hortorum pv. hederae]PUF01376.1 DNA repair protein [Xanthomonas hortorum pv. hederae]
MKPHLLRLRGFRGIRDGLGREELTLDLDRLAGDAELVALAGSNGRGKTTILDNLHPYLAMPSHVASAGAGGFSYYDHVYLPESEKELVWSQGAMRYRSHVVIRSSGRRRTEAFLFVDEAGTWVPVTLPDGAVADGKVETYARCVEALCGRAETFFASVFAAQGQRAISQYRNAEIKELLADLLGHEELRQWSQRAAETARLLKAGLSVLRQQLGVEEREARRLEEARQHVADAPGRVAQGLARCAAAADALRDAQQAQAVCMAEQQQSEGAQRERERLQAQRASLIAQGRAAIAALDAQDQRESERRQALRQRVEQRAARTRERRAQLQRQIDRLGRTAREAPAVLRAARRLPLAERAEALREEGVARARRTLREWEELRRALTRNDDRRAQIEQAAGQAVLKVEDLQRRLGLTAQVPCAGSDLQGRCQLLGDAHRAQALIPGAQTQVRRLAAERATLVEERASLEARLEPLAPAGDALAWAEHCRDRARARVRQLAARAARLADVEQARAALQEAERAAAELREEPAGERPDEQAEAARIAGARQAIAEQRRQQAAEYRGALDRVDDALRELPPPWPQERRERCAEALAQARARAEAAQRDHATAVRDAEALRALDAQARAQGLRSRALRRRIGRAEEALGVWNLFARCMGNDGLIALAIDDAGPELSGLANALLLACYGPRFTLSIHTLVATAKGEAREGFEIEVHDADSGQSKPVARTSGGERVWINACLTRAIALYLARQDGSRYETLFSDEADGALDPERKRAWMTMKREVLRLGGYGREFFISQTPELAAMADAVIDLDALVAGVGAAVP